MSTPTPLCKGRCTFKYKLHNRLGKAHVQQRKAVWDLYTNVCILSSVETCTSTVDHYSNNLIQGKNVNKIGSRVKTSAKHVKKEYTQELHMILLNKSVLGKSSPQKKFLSVWRKGICDLHSSSPPPPPLPLLSCVRGSHMQPFFCSATCRAIQAAAFRDLWGYFYQ